MDKLKGLRLVELSLQRNPLCDHFSDQADYIRSVLMVTCSAKKCGKGVNECACVGVCVCTSYTSFPWRSSKPFRQSHIKVKKAHVGTKGNGVNAPCASFSALLAYGRLASAPGIS